MFIGGLPKETLSQVAEVFPWNDYQRVHVCCSGSFRLEQMLTQRGGHSIYSNDVSLLTCALGLFAAGKPTTFTFKEELAFMEERLQLAHATPLERLSALVVAGQMSRFALKNEFARLHVAHYKERFEDYLATSETRIKKMLEGFKITDFIARDFRKHSDAAIEERAAVTGFPPTYKGGYENLYKFISSNVDWEDAPTYDMFDPKDVEPWALKLRDADVPFVVGADKRFEQIAPVASFSPNGKHTIYVYTNRAVASSYARKSINTEPFHYLPVQPEDITKKAVVNVTTATGQQMNFLKERYLARNINHVAGGMNYLVWVNGKLCGGFIYQTGGAPNAVAVLGQGSDSIFLLSDFSVTRESRVSKLIAMMATAKAFVDQYGRRTLTRPKSLVTCVFTKKPISMKYRGIYELKKRHETYLHYESNVRNQTPQEIYREWFTKHGNKAS